METVTSLDRIVTFLDDVLNPEKFVGADRCINGLQLDARGGPMHVGPAQSITKVAAAVDPGSSVIERAIESGAQLLLLHHGLLYGDLQPLVGPLGRRIRRCFEGGLSVYASHLPLDNNLEVGNAALIGRGLGLTDISPFLKYRGVTIGVCGNLQEEQSRDEAVSAVAKLCGSSALLPLNFGTDRIKSVAIASGAAAMGISEASRLGFDLYITGETSQAAYHDAKDLGMNVIFAGHYNTETFGVRKLGEMLESAFGISSIFLDEPTGI